MSYAHAEFLRSCIVLGIAYNLGHVKRVKSSDLLFGGSKD
jgi:hypothetical protein